MIRKVIDFSAYPPRTCFFNPPATKARKGNMAGQRKRTWQLVGGRVRSAKLWSRNGVQKASDPKIFDPFLGVVPENPHLGSSRDK